MLDEHFVNGSRGQITVYNEANTKDMFDHMLKSHRHLVAQQDNYS